MAADRTPGKSTDAPLILPADPLGAGLTVIEVDKAEHADDDNLKAPLGNTMLKPRENQG